MSGGRPVARPLVSVIIPVRDDERLPLCLRAIGEQSWPRDRIEIIVVENGSHRFQALENVTLIHSPVVGAYHARNLGVQAASGKVLAFTDADCIPDPDWLANGMEIFRDDPGVDIIGGDVRIFAANTHRPTPAELFELAWGFPQREFVEGKGFAATANLLVRRHVFDAVGPFNDGMFSGGDQEWGERATAKGKRMVFSPEALVRHPARHRLSDLARKYRRTCGGQYQLRRLQGRGHLKTLIKLLGRPVIALFRNTGRSSFRDRCCYCCAQSYLSFVQIVELIRLSRGLPPKNE